MAVSSSCLQLPSTGPGRAATGCHFLLQGMSMTSQGSLPQTPAMRQAQVGASASASVCFLWRKRLAICTKCTSNDGDALQDTCTLQRCTLAPRSLAENPVAVQPWLSITAGMPDRRLQLHSCRTPGKPCKPASLTGASIVVLRNVRHRHVRPVLLCRLLLWWDSPSPVTG